MGEQFPIAFGRYQLVERLAAGGMAELFVATVAGEHGFAKKVVIKRLLPNLAAEAGYTQMFIDEAKLTARLVHPKIAQTYELGRVGDELFIAMEYVDGFDVLAMLRECAQRREQLEHHLAAWIVREVLDALDYAHQVGLGDDGAAPAELGGHGVVHRDISPSNILLSARGDVKLIDFGIARAHDPARVDGSKSGTLKGKYGYMSPEQVVEEPLDPRSDLFSLGVVLAEMLTGRRLFAAANELDVLLMVRDARLTRLDKYGEHIDPGLDVIVRTALKKDVADRWQSAAAFRDAIDEWLFMQRKRVSAKMVADLVATLRPGVQAHRPREQEGGEVEEANLAGESGAVPAPNLVGPAAVLDSPDVIADLGSEPELSIDLGEPEIAVARIPTAAVPPSAGSDSSPTIAVARSATAALPAVISTVGGPISTTAPVPARAPAPRVAPRAGGSMVIQIPTGPITTARSAVPDPDAHDSRSGTKVPPAEAAVVAPASEIDFGDLLGDAAAPPAAPRTSTSPPAVARTSTSTSAPAAPRTSTSPPAVARTSTSTPAAPRTTSVERTSIPRSITPPGSPAGAPAIIGRVPTPPSVPRVGTPSVPRTQTPAAARVPTGQLPPLITPRVPTPQGPTAARANTGGIGARTSTGGIGARTSTGSVEAPVVARTATPAPSARTRTGRDAQVAAEQARGSEPVVPRTVSARTPTAADAVTSGRTPTGAVAARTATGSAFVARTATFDARMRAEPAGELDLFGKDGADLHEIEAAFANFPSIEAAIESLMPEPPAPGTTPAGSPAAVDLGALQPDRPPGVARTTTAAALSIAEDDPLADPPTDAPAPTSSIGLLLEAPDRGDGGYDSIDDGFGMAAHLSPAPVPAPPSADELARTEPPTPPPAEELEGTPDDAGEFADTPPLTVLFRLMTAKSTGLLSVAVGGIRKDIYFRDGQPEYVSSNVAGELFGSYLVSKGVMSDGELAMALAMMPHYGGKLGDTLVGLGLLKPLEVFRHLTRQVRSKIIDVCTWSKGRFEWYAGRENAREAFPLDLNTYEVLGAGAMALPVDTLDLWIERRRDTRLRSQRTSRVGPERFEIYRLADVFEALDGNRTVTQILEATADKVERTRTARLLYLLECVELARG